ncbi:MAG: alkaline phosphatase family protein [Desulfobacteraceae bacterium]|nr:alkaline phosphatase family protein [Desulfobacteraceae bacterium]
MKTMTRRMFMVASSVALAEAAMARKAFALTGYSKGNELSKIDGLELLNLWGEQPEQVQNLYKLIDSILSADTKATYTDVSRDETVQQFCKDHNVLHLGGPMLGCITETSAKVWVRTVRPAKVEVRITIDGSETTCGPVLSMEESDLVSIVPVTGLKPGISCPYKVLVDGMPIPMPEHATITTVPDTNRLRLAFGTCPHRWGLGNQRQADLIRSRKPTALLMYGDIAAQDKNNHLGKHRSDYQVRDLYPAWQSLSSTIPVYATWDDHDYFNNDKAGIPRWYKNADRLGVRRAFSQAWNNPSYGFNDERGGVFLRTRFGPCDVIMLDNRYFRTGEERGFLGNDQTEWLRRQLLDCKGPFIIISCGTMWTDHISKGKDSWGKYDPQGREQLFRFIEDNQIPGVLFLSGDRHGACGFKIPRPSGYQFYEFEVASLGGRTGPASKASGHPDALYAISGKYAFGEFTFDATLDDPEVKFRLIHEEGKTLYEHILKHNELTPSAQKRRK